jgi:PAS domain S-box-containing protein
MTSTIWWLSLVGFAMVLMGRRREAAFWGVAIPVVVVASVVAEPYIQLDGAAGEPLSEAALSKIVFTLLLIGIALGFRRAAEERAVALHDSEAELRRLKGEFEARALTSEDLALKRMERLEHINTELEQAHDALAASEKQHKDVVELVGEGIAITDMSEQLVFANPAAHEIFGVADGGLPGRRLTEFLGDDGLAALAEQSGRRSHGEATEYELPINRADGAQRILLVTATPSFDAERNVVGALAVFRDITDLRDAEARLRQSHRMEAVGQLAGGVAHDFNNLLTAIGGYTELAIDTLDEDARIRSDLEEIRNAGERAATLTRQLLAFSRKQVLTPQVLDLNRLVAGIEKLLRRTIGEDIELVTSLAPDLGRVEADPGQLEQVLVNLAVNARDAMPTGGELRIETRNVVLDEESVARHLDVAPGPHVALAVKDDGCGMDEETRAQAFEPFFTTKEKGRGTGLGLATVYGIVRQSGGTIRIDSELGEGTSVELILPRVDASVREPTEGVATAGLDSLRGDETVLVVEDDAAVRRLVASILERLGYQVLVASGGEEALDLSEAYDGAIELILTDVVMPGQSGREVWESLSRRRPEARVLYMSGHTDDAIGHHGVLDEGTVLIQKPFTSQDLARKVRKVLDGEQ